MLIEGEARACFNRRGLEARNSNKWDFFVRFPFFQNDHGRDISYKRWTRNYYLTDQSDFRLLIGYQVFTRFYRPAIFSQTPCKLLDSLKVDRRAISFVIIGNEPTTTMPLFWPLISLRTRLLNTTITKRVFFIALHISNSYHHFYAFPILNRVQLHDYFIRSKTTYGRQKSRF